MKRFDLKTILVFFLLFSLNLNAAEESKLTSAINNPDIKLKFSQNKRGDSTLYPTVVANSSGYKITEKLINKNDNSYYLQITDLNAEDSRLNVANKSKSNMGYNYTTLHLNEGKVKRATHCKKIDKIYLGFGNKYSCLYASENVCSHLQNHFKKYANAYDECKSMFKDLKKIMPFDLRDYKSYSLRERDRISQFANNHGIEAITEFVNYENVESNLGNTILLMNEVGENLRLCNEFFPDALSNDVKQMKGMPTKSSELVN
jgi:hypothetical protein